MIKETIFGFKSGQLSMDEAIGELMQSGFTPEQASRTMLAIQANGQNKALDNARKAYPVLGSVRGDTFVEQQKLNQDLLDMKAADDERARIGREKHQAVIDSMPVEPIKNLQHAYLSLPSEALRMAGNALQLATGGAIGEGVSQHASDIQADISRDFASPRLAEEQRLLGSTIEAGSPLEVLSFLGKNTGGAATLSAPSLVTSAAAISGPSALGARALATRFGLAPQQATKLATELSTAGNTALNTSEKFAEGAEAGQNPLQNMIGSVVTAAINQAIGRKLEGGAEGALARRMVGNVPVGSNALEAMKLVGSGAGKGALGELGDNSSIELGQAVSENRTPDITGTVTDSILDMAAGGLLGGVGNINVPNKQEAKRQRIIADALKAATQLTKEAEQSKQQSNPPVENKPVVEPDSVSSQEVAKESAVNQLGALYKGQKQEENNVQPQPTQEPVPPIEEAKRPVLQNRNRNKKDSIEQMQSIAANPDYGRTGLSRDFANGAPVVAYASSLVPDNQKGRTDYAVTVKGDRIPVQYAVVEADTVSTSNRADGVENPEYGKENKVTAIAGNGRVAGLTAAYERGTASNYRKELTEDALHGVNPEVINGMRNPILVRIMPDDQITEDIGDISNTASNQQLNAVEMAHNDANRVSFEGMEFGEDGAPTTESIVNFVRSMPSTERGGLLDNDGRITTQAIDRLTNAVFAKAYGNDDIIAMYAQAVDPEAKLVINALAAVAPKMAKLEGCGELDFRDALVDAVNQIVKGKRNGLKIQDIAAQIDAFENPDTHLFLKLFAQNPRSNKQVIEVLNDAAEFAYNEANRDTETENMFGEEPKTTRTDLMNHIEQTNNQITEYHNAQREAKRKQKANLQNSTGSVGSREDAPGWQSGQDQSPNERAGFANTLRNEGFSLQGQTEQEIEAEALAREEAEAEEARRDEEESKRQEEENQKKEVASLNDDYANEFKLDDDTVSGEDALVGQEGLKFSRSSKFKEAVNKVARIVDRFFDGKSSSGQGRDSFEDYLPVSKRLEDDVKSFGLDISGYQHTILDSDVAHAYNRHGGSNEKSADQVAITREDFLRLPLVVEQYDSIEISKKSTRSSNSEAIIYKKTFNDGIQYIVEEVRKGRKKLAFRTAYKKIPSVPNASDNSDPSALTSNTAEAASSVNDSISQISNSVNNRGIKFSRSSQSWQPDQELIERAKDNFGVTNDIREAFYVLPDGSMLDGSGRHWGGDERDIAGQRQVDHGDIGEVIDDATTAADAMYKWMARTGAMCFDQIVGIASIARKPTREQLSVLTRASRGKYLALSLNTPEGRIVDDTEFDRASATKIQAFFDQALEKAERGVAGAYASKTDDEVEGETADSIKKVLSNDRDIGEAFQSLSDSGEVDVVQSIDDLPEEIQRVIKASSDEIESNKEDFPSVKEEVKQKVRDLLANRGSDNVEIESDGLAVNVAWSGAKHTINFKRQDWRDLLALLHVHDLVEASVFENKEADKLGRRDPYATSHYKAKIDIDGEVYPVRIVIRHHIDGVNKFYNLGVERENPEATRERHTQELGTTPFHSSGTKGSVSRSSLVVKRSDNGDIQGLYDPRSNKVYLVASNLSQGTAKAVFLHEVGVHMAIANKNEMRPLVLQARNMVNNGFKVDNEIAKRVKQRLYEAGEIDSLESPIPVSAAEETMAYLVEEAKLVDERSPFRKWFDKLVATIKAWLVRHGINVELTPEQYVEIATGAVTQMASERNDGGLRYSKKKVSKPKIINRKSPSFVESERQERFEGNGFGKVYVNADKVIDRKGPSYNPSLEQPSFKGKGWWKEPTTYFKDQEAKNEDDSFSILEKDELGHWRWKQGRKAYDKTSAAVQMALNMIFNKASMRMTMPSVAFQKQLRDMKAEQDRGSRKAVYAAKLMQEFSPQERAMVSDLIEGELSAGVTPPEAVIKCAEMMNNIITSQSEELVELGMLSKESQERYKGHYLPRYYDRQKSSKELGFFKNLFPVSPAKGIYGSHLKGRGQKTVVPVEAVGQWIRLGWEVRDPRYEWKNNQLIRKDGQEKLFDPREPAGGMVGIWRDFDRNTREQMGEIRDAGFRFAMGQIETSKILALGRLYKWIANNPNLCSNFESEGFEYVPESVISDTGGVKRFGALAGKWVSKEVLSALNKQDQVEHIASRASRELLALWKEGKTAMNPVSHFNNTVGNWQAAHFAGVNMWDAKAYAKGMRSLLKQDQSYKEAEDAGLFTGSYVREEIAQSFPEPLRKYLDVATDDDIVNRAGDIMMKVLTFGARNALSKAYGLEDDLFKLVIYQHARKRGLFPSDAVHYAHQYVFVYDDLPSGARVLRDHFIPFFAYTYKLVPMVTRTAAYYPWRFFAPAIALYAVNKLSYLSAVALSGDDDWIDRLEKASRLEDAERELMPSYMKGFGAMLSPKFVRLGMDPTTGLPQYLNISYASPGGTLFDVENQMGGIPLPEMMMPNHPLIATMFAMIGNRDTFTGWEVVDENDTTSEKLSKWGGYLWRQMTPAIAIGNYHWSRLMSGLASATETEIPNPFGENYTGIDRYGNAMPLSVAIKNMMGLKVRVYDPDMELERGLKRDAWSIRSMASEIRSANKQRMTGTITEEAAQKRINNEREKIEEVKKKMDTKREARGNIWDLSGK